MTTPRWFSRLIEDDPRRWVPYAGHIAPDVVKLIDGSDMAMLHLVGMPFELAAPTARNDRTQRMNTLWRSLADTDLTLCIHLVRHHGVSAPPQVLAHTPFVRGLMADVAKQMTGLYRNDWFISVIIHPPTVAPTLRKLIRAITPGQPTEPELTTTSRRRQRLEDVVKQIAATLAEYQPSRLGLKDVATDVEGETLPISEIGTALHLIRTAVLEPVPHTTGSLSAAVYREPVVVKPQHFDTNKVGQARYGAMIGLLNYPAKPRVGMFNRLLRAPYPLVMTHTYKFLSAGGTAAAFKLLQDQMASAGDHATSLIKGLEDAKDDAASVRTASGLHHCGLAVYAKTTADLDTNAADASSLLAQFGGAAPTREMNLWYNGALESAYYLQLPGCKAFKPRPAKISTRDLACMASLENYPRGSASGYWGPSPIRLMTNGLTEHDFITHDDDVGHALVIGGNGRGKTVWVDLICAALEPVMGADGIRLVIDKDEANRLMIEASEGTYNVLRRNVASGLAPLVAYADTPLTRAFLHRLYTWLIMRDNNRKLTNDEDHRLQRGVARQLQMPPHKRSMWGVREFLGYADREHGAGARFERYCSGRSMGWLLDNREHAIRFDGGGLYGFDFTALIPKQEGQADDGACHVAAAVITHQLAGMMDGRRIAAFFDESKFYIEPLAGMIEDYALTGRKKELMCWLIAQQPEHFTDSAIGMSLVQQMRTKFVFPDANLDAGTLIDKLHISPAAVRQLKEDMTLGNGRRVLMWRQAAPVILELDFSNLPQLPLLSGRSRTIRLMEQAKQTGGPKQDVLEEFFRLNAIREAA